MILRVNQCNCTLCPLLASLQNLQKTKKMLWQRGFTQAHLGISLLELDWVLTNLSTIAYSRHQSVKEKQMNTIK